MWLRVSIVTKALLPTLPGQLAAAARSIEAPSDVIAKAPAPVVLTEGPGGQGMDVREQDAAITTDLEQVLTRAAGASTGAGSLKRKGGSVRYETWSKAWESAKRNWEWDNEWEAPRKI